jgi:hypothetical protein
MEYADYLSLRVVAATTLKGTSSSLAGDMERAVLSRLSTTGTFNTQALELVELPPLGLASSFFPPLPLAFFPLLGEAAALALPF